MLTDIVKLSIHGEAKHVSVRRPLLHALTWRPGVTLITVVDPEARTFTVQEIHTWAEVRAKATPKPHEEISVVKLSLHGNSQHVCVRRPFLRLLQWPPGCTLFCEVDEIEKILTVREVTDWAAYITRDDLPTRELELEAPQA